MKNNFQVKRDSSIPENELPGELDLFENEVKKKANTI
jgi:hypothetical protein